MYSAIDLHMHSTFSDGTMGVDAVIDLAYRNDVKVLSLTDHDTLEGVAAAMRHADKLGMHLIPGIEISVHPDIEEVHLLAYNFDWQNIEFNDYLQQLKADRQRRLTDMLANLHSVGVDLNLSDIAQHMDDGTNPGRPHVAAAMLAKGYVKSTQEAFDRYLKKGKPGYAARLPVDAKKIIDWIHDLGGVTSLAHPGLIKKSEAIHKMISLGIDALEVFHPDHDASSRKRFANLAAQHNLKMTVGCDYHGTTLHNAIEPGRMDIPENISAQLADFLKL